MEKSRAFYRSLGDPPPRPLRARARLGARAYGVITGPYLTPEMAAQATGCEQIVQDDSLGTEDAEFDQIVS